MKPETVHGFLVSEFLIGFSAFMILVFFVMKIVSHPAL